MLTAKTTPLLKPISQAAGDFLLKIEQFFQEIGTTENFITGQGKEETYLQTLGTIKADLTSACNILKEKRNRFGELTYELMQLNLKSHSSQDDVASKRAVSKEKEGLEKELQKSLYEECEPLLQVSESKLEAVQLASGYYDYNPYLSRATIPQTINYSKSMRPAENEEEVAPEASTTPKEPESFWERFRRGRKEAQTENVSGAADTSAISAEPGSSEATFVPTSSVGPNGTSTESNAPESKKKRKKQANNSSESTSLQNATPEEPTTNQVAEKGKAAEDSTTNAEKPASIWSRFRREKKAPQTEHSDTANTTAADPKPSVSEATSCAENSTKPNEVSTGNKQAAISETSPEILPLSSLLSTITLDSKQPPFSRPRSASVSSPSSPTHAVAPTPQKKKLEEVASDEFKVSQTISQRVRAAMAEKKSIAVMTEALTLPAKPLENKKQESPSLEARLTDILKKINIHASRKGSDIPRDLEKLYVETQSQTFVSLSSGEKLEHLNEWMNKHKPEKSISWARWFFTFQWLRTQRPENKNFFLTLRRDIDETLALEKKEINVYKLTRADSSVESFSGIPAAYSAPEVLENNLEGKPEYPPAVTPEEKQLIQCIDVITTLITDWYNSFIYLKLTPPPFVDMLNQLVTASNKMQVPQQAQSLLNVSMDNACFFKKSKHLLYNLEQFDHLEEERRHLQECFNTIPSSRV